MNENNNIGLRFVSTDFGICCMLVPHLDLSYYNKILLYGEILHSLEADSLHGESNGLDVVLDAEQFNYAYLQSNAPGFKLALHHHSDLPIMQFSSDLLKPGTETQINLKPTIISTTDNAIQQFTPSERNCYTDGEANLTHLRYDEGFRYEMNNCLIDEKIADIIWNCKCNPNLHPR